MKNEDTVFTVNGHEIGGKGLTIIAGPCAVESRDQIFDIAGKLKEMGVNFLRGGAYKPRSSPYAFQGLKEKGLQYLAEVRKEFGLGIVTEALNQITVPLVVRLEGTEVDEGRKIIAQSDVDIINAEGLTDAAKKVVAAAEGTAA